MIMFNDSLAIMKINKKKRNIPSSKLSEMEQTKLLYFLISYNRYVNTRILYVYQLL